MSEHSTEQPLEERGSNRSQRPDSAAFRAFITSGWDERPPSSVEPGPFAPFTAARRAKISELFPGERLVIPAGSLKPRSNDTDYRVRPHSAFAHLTGLGTDQEPDAVLVLHPVEDGAGDGGSNHHAVLYVRPLAPRDNDEFYADARHAECRGRARPSLADIESLTGIAARHVDELGDALAKDRGEGGVQLLVVSGADDAVEALVEELRLEAGIQDEDGLTDEALVE